MWLPSTIIIIILLRKNNQLLDNFCNGNSHLIAWLLKYSKPLILNAQSAHILSISFTSVFIVLFVNVWVMMIFALCICNNPSSYPTPMPWVCSFSLFGIKHSTVIFNVQVGKLKEKSCWKLQIILGHIADLTSSCSNKSWKEVVLCPVYPRYLLSSPDNRQLLSCFHSAVFQEPPFF